MINPYNLESDKMFQKFFGKILTKGEIMKDSGYPDDILNYSDDPRSPFYDDSGYEAFYESRVNELLEDVTELMNVDHDAILEIIFDQWQDGSSDNKKAVLGRLDDYFESLAENQADLEWSEK